MLNSNDKGKKRGSVKSAQYSFIAHSTNIKGNIKSNDDIRIDGNLEGNIETQGKLVVGKEGSIKGDVVCSNADIAGSVEGKINVKNKLALKPSAKLTGESSMKVLIVEEGALFHSKSNMVTGATAVNEFKEKLASK